MKLTPLAAAVFAGALSLTGTVASARAPGGSASTCPPKYTAMTLPALLAQAERLGVPESAARNLFATVNKNDDSWICQRKLPGEDTDINFVDNQAVGLDRGR